MQAAGTEAAAAAASARLFLALCPGPDVQAALAAHVAAWQWPASDGRYAPADWHVTLHFIGPVQRQRIDELRAGLAVPMAPFELHFGSPALWPHGLAVLLPQAVPRGLQQLHDRLGQALLGLGLRPDARPYRPHITLARRAALAQPPAQCPVFGWPVQGYALMESTGQVDQRYRVLRQFGAVA
jgi:2'-5' RNA ligase